MNFRMDRLATLYIANPLRRVLGADAHSIPILMYHSIATSDESNIAPYYRTTTHPLVFRAQMESLKKAGYSTLTIDEAVVRLHRASTGTAPGVVITFDDGFRDFYDEAAPILDEYGFTATMYLPTASIGKQPREFKGKECLTWGEVKELQSNGISFGSHTVSHPKLHGMGFETITHEVTISKDTIEQQTGHAVESFAYPYAFPETDFKFKKTMREALLHAGYQNGVCTTMGRCTADRDVFFLKRLPVNSEDDLEFFQAKLHGSYDWMSIPQYAVKVANSWVAMQRGRHPC